jgi:RNA polymerase sigma-70 factor, ECF subfamily
VTAQASTAGQFSGLHHGSDADLLAAAVRRDAAAFGRLVARYHGLVFRVVWRLTNGHAESEDIAQEAFLKLWNNPGQVREAGALKSWLLRVAHNLAMDWFRKRPTADIEDVPDLQDERPGQDRAMGQNWVSTRIDAALASLPERQRLALQLAHFEHMPQAEAAAAMDVSVDAFESLLARARRALKQILQGDRQELLAALTEEG